MEKDARQRVSELESEIRRLQNTLDQKRAELTELRKPTLRGNALTNDEIARYSRQIIVPEITAAGQLKLKASSALIIGAGGLGCPASLYLASTGIGRLGVVDYDVVETNNLHRQVLHGESALNMPKVMSAKMTLTNLNSNLVVNTYEVQLSRDNALNIIAPYDVVLDCTDNVATRYLLNDACVLAKKPLVSGSVLQLEGQLTVFNYKGSLCYRCLFPIPPPPETVTNCGDGGVLGAVTGVIGSLQALETIKILLNMKGSLAGRLLMFDGIESTFRNVKLRGKRSDCEVCSVNPIITQLVDYERFCGMRASDKDLALSVLQPNERISVEEFKEILDSEGANVLIDVRNPLEFEICCIKNSINIPLKEILENKHLDDLKKWCQRGSSRNDSQLAVKHLRKELTGISTPKDVIGGLHAWHHNIDKKFPIY